MRYLAILTLLMAASLLPATFAQEGEVPAPNYREDFASNVLPVEMVIGPQDVLEIEVFNLAELSSQKRGQPNR